MSDEPSIPGWEPITCLVLSIVGLAGSIYLTVLHFDTHIALVCPYHGPCNKILTSNQSHFLGIPVPLLGVAYFVAMTVLCLPALWKSTYRPLHFARLILSILGVGLVIYLFIEELFVLQDLCVWCTVIHLIGLALFVIIVTTSPIELAATRGRASADAS